jgi:hypothetical protein
VLWIGGAPGAGKSTVARALARRYGLRLYAADTRTWAHRDRALAEGDPAAVAFETLSPAERWDRPTGELLALSLHHRRGPMVLDDLAALPAAPLVVAEGTTLPAAAADPGRALWLVPTAELQDARLAARGTAPGPTRLYRALREVAAAEAAAHGIPVLTVVDDTDLLPAVEDRFTDLLSRGPHARDRSERQALLREQNDALAAQVRGYFTRPWATGDPDDAVLSFACECGDPTCQRTVPTRLGDR